MLKPRSKFVFKEEVVDQQVFKFMHDRARNTRVRIYDPNNYLIADIAKQPANVFTKIHIEDPSKEKHYVRIEIDNPEDLEIKFAYKMPDPDKELTGYLGFIGDQDKMTELTNILEELVTQQEEFVKKAVQHRILVKRSKRSMRILMLFELLGTGVIMFILHRDFVGMFETTRKV